MNELFEFILLCSSYFVSHLFLHVFLRIFTTFSNWKSINYTKYFPQVLLGELAISSGQVSVGGDISYASQEPWLFSASVRDNILFGQIYDEYWYKKVIQACALEKDFYQLPYCDKSLVGDKGVLLSGGQKARINLARAVYRQASIYIMDDPLSAVDTRVGKYLFNECICNVLENKTRILVTHQLQYLKHVDLIVVMNHVSLVITIMQFFAVVSPTITNIWKPIP